MPFLCPVCKKELRGDYFARTAITSDQHGGNRKCEGIGQMGDFEHVESKNQQKSKARVTGLAASAQHKQEKSVSNLNTYQTQHKNQAIQRAREETAKSVGLKGHGSADSNSKQNSATGKGLKQINTAK